MSNNPYITPLNESSQDPTLLVNTNSSQPSNSIINQNNMIKLGSIPTPLMMPPNTQPFMPTLHITDIHNQSPTSYVNVVQVPVLSQISVSPIVPSQLQETIIYPTQPQQHLQIQQNCIIPSPMNSSSVHMPLNYHSSAVVHNYPVYYNNPVVTSIETQENQPSSQYTNEQQLNDTTTINEEKRQIISNSEKNPSVESAISFQSSKSSSEIDQRKSSFVSIAPNIKQDDIKYTNSHSTSVDNPLNPPYLLPAPQVASSSSSSYDINGKFFYPNYSSTSVNYSSIPYMQVKPSTTIPLVQMNVSKSKTNRSTNSTIDIQPVSISRTKSTTKQVVAFACPFKNCNYTSSRKANVIVHMRTHTGDRPYKCTYPGCSNAFTQKISLIIHQRIHSGEKPYKCPFPGCTYRSNQKGNLNAHYKRHKEN